MSWMKIWTPVEQVTPASLAAWLQGDTALLGSDCEKADELQASSVNVDYVLIDVRTHTEFENGHIDGAHELNFPFWALWSLERKLGTLLDSLHLKRDGDSDDDSNYDGAAAAAGGDKSRTAKIVCICKMGHRSNAAVKKLLEMGYDNCCELQGGMDAFRREYPELVEKTVAL